MFSSPSNPQGNPTYGWVWYSDIWLSLDSGSTWLMMTANSAAGVRGMGSMVIDTSGYAYVVDGESVWSNWLNTAYRSRYSLYNIQQWLPMINSSVTVPASVCPIRGPSTAGPRASTGGTGTGSSSSSSGLSNGAIAGIVIGSVFGALLLCLICFFICRGRGGEKKSTSYETQPEDSHTRADDTHTNKEEGTTGDGVEMA